MLHRVFGQVFHGFHLKRYFARSDTVYIYLYRCFAPFKRAASRAGRPLLRRHCKRTPGIPCGVLKAFAFPWAEGARAYSHRHPTPSISPSKQTLPFFRFILFFLPAFHASTLFPWGKIASGRETVLRLEKQVHFPSGQTSVRRAHPSKRLRRLKHAEKNL